MRTAMLAAALASFGAAPAATASQLIDRNATGVQLEVDAKGEAMLTYTAGGRLKHVLAWGAVNAIPPNQSRPQVAFSLDYSGGYGKYRTNSYWTTGDFVCLHYDGPAIPFMVAACKAPDGSYWAVQSWERALPDYGAPPSAAESAYELHLSHWTGVVPVLKITTDWAYRGRFQHLFGTFTYGGVGVYGFKQSRTGQPLDSYGRNVYVDSFDSTYGSGWKRVNSFLTHGSGGSFCYGFYPHVHGTGAGTQYRAIVEGPGVAPDASWQGSAPAPYAAASQGAANQAILALHDPKCRPT